MTIDAGRMPAPETMTTVEREAPPDVPVVELREVVRRFPRVAPGTPAAVDGVSLTLRHGEVLALLGPSGCGKTTTLRLIAGFDRPEAGEVWLDGRLAATSLSARPAAWLAPERRRLGMVFQDYALFPHLTVAQNVAFGLRGVPAGERERRVQALLDAVDLGHLAHRLPHEISGGQQQRVALARALAPGPRAVLLDEPFNTLDAGLREHVRRDLLALLRAEGVAVVLVTHDQEEAMTCADRVAVMHAGRIEQEGAPTALYNRPATRFVASFIGEGTFVPAVLSGGRLDTPFGRVQLADPHLWLQRTDVELLVRPEEIELEPDRAGNAVVVERRARGPEVDYDLVLRPDPAIDPRRLSTVTLHAHAAAWLSPGTAVRARLAPRHLVAFRGEELVVAQCLATTCTCPQET